MNQAKKPTYKHTSVPEGWMWTQVLQPGSYAFSSKSITAARVQQHLTKKYAFIQEQYIHSNKPNWHSEFTCKQIKTKQPHMESQNLVLTPALQEGMKHEKCFLKPQFRTLHWSVLPKIFLDPTRTSFPKTLVISFIFIKSSQTLHHLPFSSNT